jgi:predicted Zn-dependent peptidase
VLDVRQANGMRVLAVHRPGVPRVEMRLRVPLVREGPTDDGTRTRLVAETLLSGTPSRSSVEIAEELQRLGADAGASADVEVLAVSGSTLAATLVPFLQLVAEAVTAATFPPTEVAVERERVAQELRIAGSQPGTIAHHALAARLYGRHPYGLPLPSPEAVRRTGPARLRRFHGERVGAQGSTLVLVGDLRPARAAEQVEESFGSWPAGVPAGRLPSPPAPRRGPVLVVDRPGAVQGNIRLGGPAVDRADPGYPSLAAASAVFGGYFASRLWANLRERRGYTYSPSAGVAQRLSASNLVVGADVATEVVGPALLETRYELGRMAESPVEEGELGEAVRYLSGSLALSWQTQAGLASQLSTLSAFGLGIEFLRDMPEALARLTPDDILDAARRWLAPRQLTTVIVGESKSIRAQVEALDEVEVAD